MSNLSKLIVSKFLGNLYFAVPIQTLFLFAKGLSFTEIMLLESVFLLGDFLFEIPTGILGDRIGRKWSIAIGKLLAILFWIPWFLGEGFWMFALSFFIGGISHAFQSGSDEALIYDELKSQGKESLMQKIMGRYLASMTLGFGFASLIGGFLAINQRVEEFYLLYKLTIVFQLIGLAIFMTIREPTPSKEGKDMEHEPDTTLKHFSGALKHLLSHKKLRRIFFLVLFTQPFSFVLIYLFQPYFMLAQVPAAWYGIAVFLASMLSIGAKLFAYKVEQWFGVDRGAFIAAALPGVCWLILSFVIHPIFSVAMYVITDAFGNMRDPIFADYTNRHIESKNRATTISIIYLVESLYMMIIRPFIGLLADMDLRYACILMGCIILAAAIGLRISEDDVKVNA